MLDTVYEVVFLRSCVVQIHNDGDGDSICAECMQRCRVGHGQTGRTCAGLVVCLNLKVLQLVFDLHDQHVHYFA